MKRSKSMQHCTQKERFLLESLRETEQVRFFSFDRATQKRLLKRMERLAEKRLMQQRKKGVVVSQSVKANAEKKDKKSQSEKNAAKKMSERSFGSTHTNTASGSPSAPSAFRAAGADAYYMAKEVKAVYVEVLTKLISMTAEKEGGDSSPSPGKKELSPATGQMSKVKLLRHLGNRVSPQKARRKKSVLKKQREQKGQKTAERLRELLQRAVKHTSSVGKEFMSAMVKQMNPKLLLIVFVAFFLLLLLCIVAALLGGFATSEKNTGESIATEYSCQVSDETKKHRSLVEKYCIQYGIPDYVNLVLAMIEQESGGTGTDVMQSEQSYYNTNPPIKAVWQSIDYGVHQFSDCLKSSSCETPGDADGIRLALQGYNFGNGYIPWAIKNDNGYTPKNAKKFSQKMCKKLGLASYGDVEYVPHVLRYYTAAIDIKNKKAAALLTELKENNVADAAVWQVIEKGASLTGLVTYGMFDPPRQADGRDNPTVLDCSSFTAWSFYKSGHTTIPPSSTTATFISSTQFVTVAARNLQVGDIGLKSATAGTGGANHVGIYCGKKKDGTKVWLHCTSESGTSLTGNRSGVMLGAYTNFTFFRRYEKFK